MSERIDRVAFCKMYVPMALKGKSALEIGKALGVDELEGKDTDDKVSQFVSQKASNYRKELGDFALATAKSKGLSESETLALVESTKAKLPKLKTRTRVKEDLSAFLDELLAECDAEPTDAPE